MLAETAARGQLAAFLVDYMKGRGSPMEESRTVLGIRYAARSESGLVRTSNEDTAYAGPRLPAVADGVRGSRGDLASAAAVEALKPLETLTVPADDCSMRFPCTRRGPATGTRMYSDGLSADVVRLETPAAPAS